MFEWLEQEISAIKTPRFHVVDGPVEAKLREAVMQSDLPLPPSYREFVLKFGNAKLYRMPRCDSYRIGVFAGPREATLSDGARIYHLGFHDGASVYVKPGSNSTELPIFEFESGSEEKVADDFAEWLRESCAHARNTYGKEKWAEIVRGPEPFTVEEQEVIEARRAIQWRVLGIDADGNHIFEMTNASRRALPVLTVGVRSKDRRLNGAVLLKIEHIGPGQTGTVNAGCYKGLVSPREIEVFALPDPQPEDRERYVELGEKSNGTGKSNGKIKRDRENQTATERGREVGNS
jgi:hypothetical protein